MIKEADTDGDGEINYTVTNFLRVGLTIGIRQYDSFQVVPFFSFLRWDMDSCWFVNVLFGFV